MKVLHVHAGNLYGGVETLLVTLARCRHLVPDMEPEFALCFSGRLRDELIAAGVRVHDLGLVRARYPWTVWRARRRLREILQSGQPEVVVCHMPWALALFGGAVKSVGGRLAFWLHNVVDGKTWVERWAKFYRPDVVVSNSQFTAASLSQLFPELKAKVIYCPLVFPPAGSTRHQTRLDQGVGAEEVVVVQVSRMQSWKGQDTLLRALAFVRTEVPWRCWLIGGAQRPEEHIYWQHLRDLTRDLGLAGKVHFLGEKNAVRDWLQAADIFCQMNTEPEPFGLVFAEAMAAGLPIICGDSGGVMELVDANCGWRLRPREEQLLADRLTQLMTDPITRERLGRAGRERVSVRCDPEARLKELYDCLRS